MDIERMQQLTKELIAIDSVTGREGEIGRFLQQELEKRGMRVQTFVVEGDRHNLLAGWGEQAPRILFNTHIDTVPQQYGPSEDDDHIYGRGACDTHGVLAAQLEAMQDLHDDGVKGLGILLVVGEETAHEGARHAAKTASIKEPEVLIVGEPTENKLITAQKGRVKADLLVHGVAGHSGYPERCDSAVQKLCFFLDEVWRTPWIKEHSEVGTTVNAVITDGGKADNQIPAIASARLMFRSFEPCGQVRNKFAERLQELEITLPLPKSDKPHYEILWEATPSEPVLDLCTVPGIATDSAAFNTDINYFGWNNCRKFLLGAGSISQAHRDLNQDDWHNAEWISKQEQIRGVELYKHLVQHL